MGTKNNPSQFDCYANAEPDEPMFILLARDKHAPTLVWLWATLRELDKEKPEITEEARACAMQMVEWAHKHDRKSVGLAQATLAGIFELIRVANHYAKDAPKNEGTHVEIMRRWLALTKFEEPEGAAK